MIETLQSMESQLRVLLLQRALFGPGQLLRASGLPLRWAMGRGRAPWPVALAWYLTFACTERCTFCDVRPGGAGPLGEPVRELDAVRGARLLEELVPRIPTVAFGGGEPLLHPSLVEHVARVRTLGGRSLVATSGVLLDRALASSLLRAGPTVLQFSVLGDPPTHDRLMGGAGAHDRAIAGLERALSLRDPRKTRILVNLALGPENLGSAELVARQARALGVDALRVTWLSFVAETESSSLGSLGMPDEVLSGVKAERIEEVVRSVHRAWPGHVSFLPHLDRSERARWFQVGGGLRRPCASLWHTLFLRPDGRVAPCGHMLAQPIGEMPEGSLDASWNHPKLVTLRQAQRRDPFPICWRCCKV